MSRTLPGGQVERLGYDLSGNVICHTNFNGVVMTNAYDVMNRLTTKTSAGGYKVLYGYTSTGLRMSATNEESTTEYH